MNKQQARQQAKEDARVQQSGGFAIMRVPVLGSNAGYMFEPVSGVPSDVPHLSPLVEEWYVWNGKEWEKQKLP